MEFMADASRSSLRRPVKLADKIANLRDVPDSPPVNWPLARRQEYFDWAKQVVEKFLTLHRAYCLYLWPSMVGDLDWLTVWRRIVA